MSTFRSVLAVATAVLAVAACTPPDEAAPTGPAVPRPQLQASIDNSTPDEAMRGMSNKTWLWTRGDGPAQIHYSTPDGRDYAWLVGQRQIAQGQWQVNTAPGAGGRMSTQICLRYPGSYLPGLGAGWTCREAGTMFYQMTEREAGDPLRINGRSEALFVLDRPPASLAEVQSRVRG